MRAMHVQGNVCSRAKKEIMALSGVKGIEVVLATGNTYGMEAYVERVHNIDFQERDTLKKKLTDAFEEECPDIVHSHNTPDIFTEMCLDIRYENDFDFKVVHDCHDVSTLYGHKQTYSVQDTEAYVMENSDAVSCVGTAMADMLKERYEAKSFVLHTLPCLEQFPDGKLPKWQDNMDKDVHVAYIGGIGKGMKHFKDKSHRYFRDIFRGIIRQNIHLYAYTNYHKFPVGFDDWKSNPYFHPHICVLQEKVYQIIPTFTAGCVLYNRVNVELLDIAMPNKLFEYIVCGIPVVVVKDDMIMPTDLDFYLDAKERIHKIRHKFLMDNEIKNLVKIYRGL